MTTETRLSAVLIGKFVGRGAQFALGFILAQRLGVVLFGTFALGYTLFKFAGTALVPLGLSRGVLRYGAAWGDATYSTALVITSLAGGGVAAGMWWLAEPAAAGFQAPAIVLVLRVFAVFVPAVALVDVCAASLRAMHRVNRAVWLEDVIRPVIALGLVMLWPRLTPATAALALGISYAVAAVPLVAVVAARWARPRQVRSLMRYSLVAMLFVLLMLGLQWLDRILIGVLFTVREVGLYQAAAQLSAVFGVIIAAEVAVIAPQISTLYNAKQWEKLEESYQQTTLWGYKLSLAVYALVINAPVLLLFGVYGAPYVDAAPILIILSTAQLVNALTGACATFMLVTAQQNQLALIYAVAMLINGGASVLLANLIGVEGVALGTAFALTFATVAMTVVTRNQAGIVPFNRAFLAPTAATLGALVLFALVGITSGPLWQAGVALWASAAASIYVLYPDVRRFLLSNRAPTQ